MQQEHQRQYQRSNSIHSIKKVLDERDCHPRPAIASPPSDCWTSATEAISSFSELEDEFDDGEDNDSGGQQRVMVTLLSASMTMMSFDDTTLDDSPSSGRSPVMILSGNTGTLSSTTENGSGSNTGRLVSTQRLTTRENRSVSNTRHTPAVSATSVSASRSTWCDNTTACAAATGAILYHGDDDDDVNDVGRWEGGGVPSVITLIHDDYCYDKTTPRSGNSGPVRGADDGRGGRDLSEIFNRRSSVGSAGSGTSVAILLRQVDGAEHPTPPADEDVDAWKGRLERAEALVVSYRAVLQSQDHLIESLEQTLYEVRDSAQDLVAERDRLSQELDDTLDEHDDAMNRVLMERANKVAIPRIVLLGLSMLYYLCGGTEYLLILSSTFCLLEEILTVCFPCS
jgi:hypothetical protein